MDGNRREAAEVKEPVSREDLATLQAPWNGKGEHAGFGLPDCEFGGIKRADTIAQDTTNPKDPIGARKVPLGLLPAAGKIYGAMAMKTGAEKYGPYNWRDKKVRMTVYLDAIERHLLAIYDGQSVDSESGLPHLGHIIASASILADAVEGGFIIDDRPPKGPAAETIARANKS